MFGGVDETAVFHIPVDDVSFSHIMFAVDCVFTTLQSFAPMEMQLSELIETIQTSTGNKRQILNQFVDAQLNSVSVVLQILRIGFVVIEKTDVRIR